MSSDQTADRHPYWQGYHGRCVGLSEYDNPFSGDSWQFNAWQHGWDKCDEDIERDVAEGQVRYEGAKYE